LKIVKLKKQVKKLGKTLLKAYTETLNRRAILKSNRADD